MYSDLKPAVEIITIIIIMAYTAAFPQSSSSSAGIWVINASDIGQLKPAPGRFTYTLFFSAVGSLKSLVGRLGQWLNSPHPRTEGSSDRRWKTLLTYGTGIRSPAENQARATLVEVDTPLISHADHPPKLLCKLDGFIKLGCIWPTLNALSKKGNPELV